MSENQTGHLYLLNLTFQLPPQVPVDIFDGSVASSIEAIDFIYSVLAFLYVNPQTAVSNLANFIQEHPYSVVRLNKILRDSFEANQVAPLRVASVRYGSPASVDLLGIGNILEVIWNGIKDLRWRDHHEEKKSALEIADKEIEIEQKKLEIEKTKLELKEEAFEFARKVLDALENPDLSEEEKNALISILVPKIQTFADTDYPIILRLES